MSALRLALQHALPHRLLSRLVLWATRWRLRPWKDFLIRRIVAGYGVDLEEAETREPSAYPHFDAFFTRALRPGARPLDPDPKALLIPADGRISQLGRITGDRIFQAKGHDYEVAALLADPDAAETFGNGHFATVYLSPRDYHRAHIPWTGKLLETVHVPGRLFSVAPFAVEGIPGLFARNERLVCRFETDFGEMAMVMVGAMLVSGVETVWRGVEIPPYASHITRRDYRGKDLVLERGAEMARFHMGSTVIVLLPDAAIALAPGLGPEQPVRMGQRLATAEPRQG